MAEQRIYTDPDPYVLDPNDPPDDPPSGGKYDPQRDPSRMLGALGFQWLSGNGPYALWRSPTGQVMSEQAAVALVRRAETARPERRTYSGAGLPPGYVQGSDGVVYRQYGDGLMPASQQELDALNAPRPAAPRAPSPPHTYTEDATGDVVAFDPFSGRELYRITGANWAQISPQEKERIRQGDLDTARRHSSEQAQREREFTTARDAAQRGFTASENATDRASREAESAASRAARAAEFAANYGLSEAERRDRYNQYVASFQQQEQQRKLDAARQFAGLVSSTDPGALRGFMAAGGGNIMNAIGSGANALSPGALLPAAQTLRASETNIAPAGFTPASQGLDPVSTKLAADQARAAAMVAAINARPQQFPAPPSTQWMPGNEGFAGMTPQQAAAASGPTAATQNAAMQAAGVPSWVTPFSADGVVKAAQGFSGVVNGATPIVAGENGPEQVEITPIDAPYVDRVRKLRQSTDVTPPIEGGIYNAGWGNVAPDLQDWYVNALQTRYGVGARNTRAEQQRFALKGFQQPYRVGY